jgi:hypothetical protein
MASPGRVLLGPPGLISVEAGLASQIRIQEPRYQHPEASRVPSGWKATAQATPRVMDREINSGPT